MEGTADGAEGQPPVGDLLVREAEEKVCEAISHRIITCVTTSITCSSKVSSM